MLYTSNPSRFPRYYFRWQPSTWKYHVNKVIITNIKSNLQLSNINISTQRQVNISFLNIKQYHIMIQKIKRILPHNLDLSKRMLTSKVVVKKLWWWDPSLLLAADTSWNQEEEDKARSRIQIKIAWWGAHRSWVPGPSHHDLGVIGIRYGGKLNNSKVVKI